MISFLSDLAKGLVNLAYPLACESCGIKINTDTERGCLCRNCLKQMATPRPANPVKHRNINVWSVCVYEGVSRKCIHLFKYSGRLNLAKPLSRLMSDFTNMYLRPYNFDITVPVPLHKTRLRQRGFNQAELLAKRLSGFTGRPVMPKAIKRVKPTPAQTGLSKTKRFANLKGAFKISRACDISGKNILLIDDVFTTGSTIGECSKTLLKAKAKSVEALVLAKGI